MTMQVRLYVFLVSLAAWFGTTEPSLTKGELRELLKLVKGKDDRIIRWDATEFTGKQQYTGGCDSLADALETIIDQEQKDEVKSTAAEYATFCITDNASLRQSLSDKPSVYSSVADLVESSNAKASAMASHLIYIASFNNEANQDGFFQAGAVSKLSAVVRSSIIEQSNVIPLQIMWAAAALQNLAASYCATDGDGRCYWIWPEDGDSVVVEPESLPIMSDGQDVREQIQQDSHLIEILVELSCQGPVDGKMSDSNPFPGGNAKLGVHDLSYNIIPWAAAGALKNIALDPDARERIEHGLPCFCRLFHSPDWLEANKGQGLLHHLRRDDPCWFEDEENTYGSLCIDHVFLDEEGYTCSDYGDATEEECENEDSNGISARVACCACDGGDWIENEGERDEL